MDNKKLNTLLNFKTEIYWRKNLIWSLDTKIKDESKINVFEWLYINQYEWEVSF